MAKTPKAGPRQMASFRLPVATLTTIRTISSNTGLSATDVLVLAVSTLKQGTPTHECLPTDDQLDLFGADETA